MINTYQQLVRELEEFARMIAHGFTLLEEEQRRYERLKILLKIA